MKLLIYFYYRDMIHPLWVRNFRNRDFGTVPKNPQKITNRSQIYSFQGQNLIFNFYDFF